MRTTWSFLLDRLTRGESAMALLVVESRGSAPGREGFLMGVSVNGETCGTVGGGVMEFNLVRRAMEMLAANATEPMVLSQVHRSQGDPAHQSGLICSGSQRIALVPISSEHIDGLRLALATSGEERRETTAVFSSRGFAVETSPGSAGFREDGASWHYRLPLGREVTVYVVGGGHVGWAVCRALALLDVRVIVTDHRADLATFAQNQSAHELWVCPYADLRERIPAGPASFVAVVTSAMPHDVEALLALWDKPLGYLGLMGSEAKVAHILAELSRREIPAEALAHLRAPIGLSIGAASPAEIGLSVAAEIVSVLRNAKGDFPVV